jgi:hypothetical protein
MKEAYKAVCCSPLKSSFYLTGFPSEQAQFGNALYADQVPLLGNSDAHQNCFG